MTGPLRWPDPAEVRQARADAHLNARDQAASEPLRAEHDAAMAARESDTPAERAERGAAAAAVFGRQERTAGRPWPRLGGGL